MQKKLIALAVAGLVSGGAFAQSNVTVYGVADATFDSVSAKDAVASGDNQDRYSRVSTNSSYVGFKGTEALGNGLSAIFQVETTVQLDASTTANPGVFGTTRDTFVGVKSDDFGTVQAGVLTGPTRALGAAVDLYAGATGVGANNSLIGKFGGAATGTFDTRFGNALAYTSPTFAGFNAVAAYTAGENRNQQGDAKVNGYGYDLGAFYNNGPIFAGLTYGRLTTGQDAAIAGSDNDYASLLRAAVTYQALPALKLSALVEQSKAQTFSYGDAKQTRWGLGAKYNVTPAGAVIAQFYKANDIKDTNDTGAKLFSLGYEHSLSKRTVLKATYSRITNDDNAKYDFGIGALNANNPVGAGSNPQAFSFGVRHSF